MSIDNKKYKESKNNKLIIVNNKLNKKKELLELDKKYDSKLITPIIQLIENTNRKQDLINIRETLNNRLKELNKQIEHRATNVEIREYRNDLESLISYKLSKDIVKYSAETEKVNKQIDNIIDTKLTRTKQEKIVDRIVSNTRHLNDDTKNLIKDTIYDIVKTDNPDKLLELQTYVRTELNDILHLKIYKLTTDDIKYISGGFISLIQHRFHLLTEMSIGDWAKKKSNKDLKLKNNTVGMELSFDNIEECSILRLSNSLHITISDKVKIKFTKYNSNYILGALKDINVGIEIKYGIIYIKSYYNNGYAYLRATIDKEETRLRISELTNDIVVESGNKYAFLVLTIVQLALERLIERKQVQAFKSENTQIKNTKIHEVREGQKDVYLNEKIRYDSEQSEYKGGHHSSPRAHYRQGCIVHRSNGTTFYRKGGMVNDHKEGTKYKVTKQEDNK